MNLTKDRLRRMILEEIREYLNEQEGTAAKEAIDAMDLRISNMKTKAADATLPKGSKNAVIAKAKTLLADAAKATGSETSLTDSQKSKLQALASLPAET